MKVVAVLSLGYLLMLGGSTLHADKPIAILESELTYPDCLTLVSVAT